ncbi:MAG: hypothetical protein GF346_09445, partial [Candidatus Eisenbacteria bacterium]|nr:hypothetical protein [Candidatus Latescibacterota bacterium]MBD3302656.1 hypothetical protein [Candidatus Eisenbacteria bacterium]
MVLVIGISFTGTALAETPPDQGPARESAPQQTEEVQAPNEPIVESAEVPIGPMILRTIPTADPNDKGSTYTDMGTPGGATLNALEEAKLAMARRAIEASRRAGTL